MDALLTRVTRHFEYLGYDVVLQPDGWSLATHAVRLNVLFKPFAIGVRLHCALWLGTNLPDMEAWHDYLNHANDVSAISRYALAKGDDGEWSVRVRALLPSRYDRKSFGLLLDAWQEDVGRLRFSPRHETTDATDDAVNEEDEQKAAVVVN
jgi:hypothetical protein